MSSMEKLNKSDDSLELLQDDLRNVASRDTIPQISKTAEFILTSIFSVTLLGICIKMVYKESLLRSVFEVVTMTSVFSLALIICGFVLRLCNFLSEIQLIKSHYEDKFINVVNATFEMNGKSVAFFIVCLICILIYFVREGNPVDNTWGYGPWACLTALALAIILCHFVDLNESKYMTARTMRSLAGVDYGGGMAFSYFYGYLRIVLPGLRKKIEQYEAVQGVTIPVKKMFILIPESGHIPPDLRDASREWLEGTTITKFSARKVACKFLVNRLILKMFAKSLEHEVRDRAGVKRRNYKNTIYKIHRGGIGSGHRPIYVPTEGATPMLTFWEILTHNHEQTATYRQNRMQIVSSFYKTLNELIENDPECRDVCELVYYKDYKDGKKVNVGEILLTKICEEAPVC